MVRKTLSMFLSFLMITTGILPIRSAGAQEKREYNIAVLDLDANGISSAEAKSLSNNMHAQIMRVINSKEFGKKTPISFWSPDLKKLSLGVTTVIYEIPLVNAVNCVKLFT